MHEIIAFPQPPARPSASPRVVASPDPRTGAWQVRCSTCGPLGFHVRPRLVAALCRDHRAAHSVPPAAA